jgi:2-haloacid dehalogenase
MNHDRYEVRQTRLRPTLISFDVGTLISVRESSYGAFERILAETGARRRESILGALGTPKHRPLLEAVPNVLYREICQLSLEETFAAGTDRRRVSQRLLAA